MQQSRLLTQTAFPKVVLRFAARIASEQDPTGLLLLNADMARDLVNADRCSIWLVDSQANELRTTVAHGMDEMRIAMGHGLVGACIAGDEAIVVNDVAKDERFLGRIDQASGYITHSVLVLPLRAGGKVIGALQVLNKPGGFTDRDINLLGLAAAYSASAIETQRLRHEAEAARLIMRELEIAHDVQSQLLPREAPAVAGLDYSTFFRSAKSVGGDYYDFVVRPDGRFAFTLGDVSGKGIAAALLMASIQSSVRATLLAGTESLPEAVTTLNRTVLSCSAADKYSTLFCGRFDPETLGLTYVNAGGVPPLLLRHTGQGVVLEQLSEGGCPVGLLAVARYEQARVQLSPGDVILCCSDGITEAMNAKGDMWDEAQAEVILRANASRSATTSSGH